RRRHTRFSRDWSSDVCSSDLIAPLGTVPESADIGADLLRLIACPDLANRRWIYEQYDSQVGADTLQKSGGDAAVVRVHGTQKARSEERRVGKECRAGRSACQQ